MIYKYNNCRHKHNIHRLRRYENINTTYYIHILRVFHSTSLPQKLIHSVCSLPLEKQVEKSIDPVNNK